MRLSHKIVNEYAERLNLYVAQGGDTARRYKVFSIKLGFYSGDGLFRGTLRETLAFLKGYDVATEEYCQ